MGSLCYAVPTLIPGDHQLTATVRDDCGIVYDVQSIQIRTLDYPPGISRQPSHQMVFPTQPAAFTAVVTGGTPLTYQWKRDGTNLIGAPIVTASRTSTLQITNVQTFDAAAYSVEVSNSYGTITSVGANLTVNERPLLRTVGITTNRCFQLSVLGPLDQVYVLESSTILSDWIPVATHSSVGNYLDFIDNETNDVQRFYRVMRVVRP